MSFRIRGSGEIGGLLLGEGNPLNEGGRGVQFVLNLTSRFLLVKGRVIGVEQFNFARGYVWTWTFFLIEYIFYMI